MPRPRVVVVGLGPAGPDMVTVGALDAIASTARRFVRTTRHPAAGVVDGAVSFDAVYDAEPTFDAVYRRIADELVAAAADGPVVYAVPGSPRVLERTVEHLVGDERVAVEIVPGLSFLDLAWVRLGIDPIERGVRLVDGHRFAEAAAGERGPLIVAHCHNQRVLSDIKLELDLDGPPVTVVQRLGLPDEAVFTVERAELDRTFTPDHLTSVWIPDAGIPVASAVARFDALVHTLRADCPWDREQTHASLTRHLIEETYEVLEAIAILDPESGQGYDHLKEELGDVLFQVVFHATLAAEAGAFTLADVADGIHDKLVTRHPHVFGGEAVGWEELKKAEKGRASIFDGIPAALPALLYAAKVLGKAESLGVTVEPMSLAAGADAGAALLALVAACRARDVDPEAALRAAVDRLRSAAAATEQPPS
ncbi:MAG: MazG nucleotide pyrophosphohydrolase domain-containing protein [Acidimicrobiales bacterium]